MSVTIGLVIDAETVVAMRHASGRPDAYARADLAAALPAGKVDNLVVAVPDDWFDGTAAGAGEGESVRSALADLGAPPSALVPWSLAAAVEDDGPVIVCTVTADRVTATTCDVARGTGQVRDSRTAAFARSPRRDDLCRLLVPSGSARDRRDALVLARARAVPRYLSTPVGPPVASRTITAGEVLDAFAPARSAVREVLPAGGSARVVLCGDPVAVAVLLDDLRDAAGVPVEVLDAAAPARGAALIAGGAVTVRRPQPYTVDLPVRRLRAGMLVSERLPLVAAGDEPPVTVRAGGRDVEVEVPATASRPFSVELRRGGTATVRALPSVPAGRYRIGLWPALSGPGVLVLRPVGGGPCQLMPLDGPEDRT
jgi:hypothetical protein